MKLSARNILKGKVTSVKNGAVAAQIQVNIGGGNIITSMITRDLAKRLGLKKSKTVSVIIKANEVILGVD